MKPSVRLSALALALAMFASPALAQQAAPSNVSIVVNGSPVTFDQPPVERAGRIFVPLRGVFEQLGATVVYANGTINAQGHNRSVSLNIGSTQATVNGQITYLDQAPFLIGARTLVPLRFVAQALGASVNYNGNNQTVYVNNGGRPNPGGPMMPPAPAQNPSFHLVDTHPNSTVNTLQPRIGAAFSEPVDRDSVRVHIDGVDVTGDVYVNGAGTSFYVTPAQPLSLGSHNVRVSGTTQLGAAFVRHWSFTTQDSVTRNFVRIVSPTAGSGVPSTFMLVGRTLPNSRVHVIATTVTHLGPIPVGTGTFEADTQADDSGHFTQQVQLNGPDRGAVRVLVQSQSPDGASAQISEVY